MKPMPKRLLGMIILAGILTGCQNAAQSKTAVKAAASAGGIVGQVFPDFKLKTLDGQTTDLKAYQGKMVIMDLFATWCPPCRMEIPHLVALQTEYPDQLQVVGLDYEELPREKLQAFMQEMKINYPVYWGSEEIAQYVNLRGIPHLLVLDAEGKVYRSYVGYQDKSVLESDLQSLKPKAK